MKNLIVISMIVASTFASAGMASAASVALIDQSGWQFEAFNGGNN